ncbi:family 43 glycosylhydrolase [Paenibacillus albicereus]|uniref:Family 43 glycosylhydrolase n=2 Tax=Paenibacillus albicereus TaxID=2726185 RepID=A0A6H2H431_9BACL|nr:family 43 glycosylhydrolase [Paenibacillus albicereus]
MKRNRRTALLLLLIAGGGYWMWSKQERSDEAGAPYVGHGGTFKNTLAEIDTPDPSVVYDGGFYYMTFTHGGTDIMVMKSRTLDFRAAERKVVWRPPVGAAYSANLWAPEIQHVRGKWYIYFAADDGDNANHRMYALEAATDDPLGEYAFQGQITDETDKWAIDGLVMEQEDRLYFVWSGWEGDVNEAQNTYIAPMSDPLTISGPRVLLSRPDLEWEKAGGPPYINEGQSVLQRDGRVHIVYSGAGSWTPYYSLGVLSLREGGDPLRADDWSKHPEPLLAMNAEAGVYGPGHNSFAPSPDGTETWLVYHATSGESDGWANRKARAAKVGWTGGGLPDFGKPQPLAAAIEAPSGMGVLRAEEARAEGDALVFSHIASTVETTVPVLLQYRLAEGGAGRIALSSSAGEAVAAELEATAPGETGYAYAELLLPEGGGELRAQASGGAELLALELPRFEAEWGEWLGGAEESENVHASRGAAALLHEPGDGVRLPNVRVPQSGAYTVSVAVLNPADGARLELSAGGTKRTLDIEPQERGELRVYEAELKLSAGANAIELTARAGSLRVDWVDIWIRPGG